MGTRLLALGALYLVLATLAMGLSWPPQVEALAVRAAASEREGREAEALLLWARASDLLPEDEGLRLRSVHVGFPLRSLFQHPGPAALSAFAFSMDGTRVATGTRGGEVLLWNVSTGRPLGPPFLHREEVTHLAFDPSGERLLTCSRDGTARVLSGVVPGSELRHGGAVLHGSFSPDGRRVATASRDETVRVWEVPSLRQELPPLASIGDEPRQVIFSPDGRRIAARGFATLRLWDATTGVLLGRPVPAGSDGFLSFTLNSRQLVYCSPGAIVRVLDTTDGEPVPVEYGRKQGGLHHAVESPDGRSIATFLRDGSLALVSFRDREDPVVLEEQAPRGDLLFSPQGRWLASLAGRSARIFDLETLGPAGAPLDLPGQVAQGGFGAEGTLLAVACTDGTVRVHEMSPAWAPSARLEHRGMVNDAQFSPDGRLLVTGAGYVTGSRGEARLWEVPSGRQRLSPIEHEGAVIAVGITSDGQRVLTSTGESSWVRDLQDGRPLYPPVGERGSEVAFSPDGSLVLQGTYGRHLRFWRTEGGGEVGPPLQMDASIVGFARDGRTAVAVQRGGRSRLVVLTPEGLVLDEGLTGDCLAVGFSPDGRILAVASDGASGVELWDMGSRRRLPSRIRHGNRVLTLSIDPSSRWIATGSTDRTARIWSAEGGEPLSPPLRHDDAVDAVAFSPTRPWLATLTGVPGSRGALRLWDVSSGLPLSAPIPHADPWGRLRFSPDGRYLLSASGQSALLWDLSPGPADGGAAERNVEGATGFRLDPSGTAEPIPPQDWWEFRERGPSSRGRPQPGSAGWESCRGRS